MIEAAARAAVVAEGMAFLGTPYHHTGRIKGAGVDCLTLIVCAAQRAGVIGDIVIPPYTRDFNLHRGDETYLDGLLGYMHEVEKPDPADVVLWRFGRCFSHAAIVIEWPTVIHAHIDHGVVLENADTAPWLNVIGETDAESRRPRPRKFLSYWK